MKPGHKSMIASYARSAIGAALALYLARPNDVTVRDLVAAGIAAIAPPLLRWLNPSDQAFGRTAK
jgi:hypothetical protein